MVLRIVDNASEKVPFSSLTEGDLFREEGGILLMKISSFETTDGCYYNCIDLENACPYGMELSDKVTKISKAVLTLN